MGREKKIRKGIAETAVKCKGRRAFTLTRSQEKRPGPLLPERAGLRPQLRRLPNRVHRPVPDVLRHDFHGGQDRRRPGPLARGPTRLCCFRAARHIGGSSDTSTADTIKFQIVNATKDTYGVSLSPDQSGLTYIDEHQIKRLAPNEWTATWLIGFGSLVNPGERVEIAVDLTSLNPRLGSSQEFFIELTTGGGATLRLRRVTPARSWPSSTHLSDGSPSFAGVPKGARPLGGGFRYPPNPSSKGWVGAGNEYKDRLLQALFPHPVPEQRLHLRGQPFVDL